METIYSIELDHHIEGDEKATLTLSSEPPRHMDGFRNYEITSIFIPPSVRRPMDYIMLLLQRVCYAADMEGVNLWMRISNYPVHERINPTWFRVHFNMVHYNLGRSGSLRLPGTPEKIDAPLRIVAAACYAEGITFSVPASGRHCHILRLLSDSGSPLHEDTSVECLQGFLTNYGYFVTRREAFNIVDRSNQRKLHDCSEIELFSEDLW